jgi:single-strand DNA-binding protein
VYVEGRLQTRSYDDRDGVKRYVTEVVAQNIVLLGGGENGKGVPEKSRAGQSGRASGEMSPRNPQESEMPEIVDDSVPF